MLVWGCERGRGEGEGRSGEGRGVDGMEVLRFRGNFRAGRRSLRSFVGGRRAWLASFVWVEGGGGVDDSDAAVSFWG